MPLVALGVLAALFLLRSHDDNRLTSWRWAFDGVSPAPLFALAAAALALAALAARLPLPGRRPVLVLVLSALAAAAGFLGEPEVIVDASRYFTEAKYLEVHGPGWFLAQWGRGIPAWTDLPLVPLLQGLVLRGSGESRLATELAGSVLFAGSAAVTYAIGRELWDEDAGFMAGALLLAIPYLLVQVPLLLVDVPTMFFVSLAVLASIRAFRRPDAARIALASAAVSLALLSKWSASIVLAAVPVAWAVQRRERTPGILRAGALVAGVPAAVAGLAILARPDVLSGQFALLAGFQGPGLRRWGESFASTFLFQVHPFVTAAAVAGVVLAVRRRDARVAIALAPVLLLLALRVERARYLVPALPMLALLGACGLGAIRARETRHAVVACAVASSLVVALYAYLPFLRRDSSANVAAAGAYLDGLPEDRVVVLTPAGQDDEVNPAVAVPLLDLFTRKRLVHGGERTPPPPGVATSALRFTWEYRDPPWYADAGDDGSAAVAVVADDLARPFSADLERRLAGYRLDRAFTADTGLHRHRTLVAVYRAATPAAPAGR